MERNTVKDRLIAYLSEKKLSKAEFGRRIGASSAFVTSMRKSMQPDKIERIAQEFPDLNIVWLQTGDGEMLKGSAERSDVSLCFETIQGGIGHGTGAEQMTKANAVGVMAVPGVPIGEGTPYIQVRGSSMVNRRDPAHSIPEGAWIGIQPSQSSVIRWGEVYAVMTTDGPVVKKLMPSEREGYITCVSFNEEDGYLPYELPTNEIIQPLYKVVAVITAQRWA